MTGSILWSPSVISWWAEYLDDTQPEGERSHCIGAADGERKVNMTILMVLILLGPTDKQEHLKVQFRIWAFKVCCTKFAGIVKCRIRYENDWNVNVLVMIRGISSYKKQNLYTYEWLGLYILSITPCDGLSLLLFAEPVDMSCCHLSFPSLFPTRKIRSQQASQWNEHKTGKWRWGWNDLAKNRLPSAHTHSLTILSQRNSTEGLRVSLLRNHAIFFLGDFWPVFQKTVEHNSGVNSARGEEK